MSEQNYDLIVIGGGPGGYVASIRAAQLGLNVACVEKEAVLGGTCLRVGCIPSKSLLESSHHYDTARRHMAEHGVSVGDVGMDVAAMLKRKEGIVAGLGRGIDGLLKKNKVARVLGSGRLAGEGRVIVSGAEGETALSARHIIIATGSKPAALPGVELDGDRIGTSTEALAYPEVPQHLVVIGAGVIGLELGTVWSRLGAKVTVLEYLDRILPGTDSEIALEAKKIFNKQGFEFRLGAKVTSAAASGGVCRVEAGEMDPIECDRVLLAVGRTPNTDGLGLENVGIQTDRRGCIPVNDSFATSAPGIHAIGDVIPGPMLAHKAEEDGVACVEKIVTGTGHVDYNLVPAVCYTDPEIASVGRTEDQLQEAGVDYRKGVFHFRANGRAHTVGRAEGRVKVLADAKNDRALGVHILGPNAGDLIAEAAVGMAFGASAEDLARACHAHPTLSEALKEAALAVDGRAIHS